MPRAQHRLVFESVGAVGEVLCDDRGLFDSLPEVLPPGWRAASGEPVAPLRADRRPSSPLAHGVSHDRRPLGLFVRELALVPRV